MTFRAPYAHKLYKISYPYTLTLLHVSAINCNPQRDVNKKHCFHRATAPIGPRTLHHLVFMIGPRHTTL